MDGSWWCFDDTRVTKVDSPSEIKTASAYILFYTKRGSPSASVQHQQHWCKSLIKKYQKPALLPISHQNGDYKKDNDKTTSSSEKLTNGYHSSEESDKKDQAPLAQDEVSVNHVKDLQIESTV